MNQRVPDSGGLPLRAMVMVLLFLGLVFLLLGLQALLSNGNSSNQPTAMVSTTTATPTTTTPPPAPAKAAVFVYNISTVTGLAGNTAQQLKDAGWNAEAVQQTPDPHPDVSATTVYYSDIPGEKESADQVAKVLNAAPPVPRAPELVDLPPGVIVIVTG
ncbi:MAG TPA: LytR C-terminal domain-containing protein [Mycobacterium sp.]|nr:LytR C-terminal domain-containing protein [Mycobacterium sp.]